MPLVIVVGLAASVTLMVTEPLRRIALRWGILDRPSYRKVHRRPIPYLGGIAVNIGAAAAVSIVNPRLATTLLPVTLVVAVGLYDDIRGASVPLKLAGECVAAAMAVALGLVWHATGLESVDIGLSMLWMVSLANMFNLLDNMDGLSTIVGAAVLAGLALMSPGPMFVAAAFSGATAAFLRVNRPPARMFLGDAGSLSIGFVVAISTIALANASSGLRSVLILGCPVVVVIFDTSLVIVSRLRAGRPVQLGGRDHFSHRLLLVGCSRRQVLLMASVVTVSSLLMTFVVQRYPAHELYVALPLVALLAITWMWLQTTDPYEIRFSPQQTNDRRDAGHGREPGRQHGS